MAVSQKPWPKNLKKSIESLIPPAIFRFDQQSLFFSKQALPLPTKMF